jgi:creatinine amidohydrolase
VAMFAGARAGGCEPPAIDMHADGVETSQGLAAFPQFVRPFDGVEGYTAAEDGRLDRMFSGGIDAIGPSGVLGDARPATPLAGEAIFAHLTDYLTAWITASLSSSIGTYSKS